MKVLIILAIIGFVAIVSEARMNAFMCSDDCYSYDNGPFCMSDGSVICDNCERDKAICDDSSLSVSSSGSDCNKSC